MAAENSQLIADLSDQELQDLGTLGPGQYVHEDVQSAVLAAKKSMGRFRWLTVSHVQSLSTYATFHTSPPPLPISPASDTIAFSLLSDATVVDPDFASPFEKAFFYKGVSEDHPPPS
ncbi:hypothetical protein B0H15DRAFT_957436 [Mycena belliarum]|uniref:Uncharacterized protein n=1 Tax=Mycena belliarum TaxID=1033014 RepID=A0AAD6TMU2_9AGAR|nr:hypothetical protein B0H15DRAFT_957436 [Mycena belliae]